MKLNQIVIKPGATFAICMGLLLPGSIVAFVYQLGPTLFYASASLLLAFQVIWSILLMSFLRDYAPGRLTSDPYFLNLVKILAAVSGLSYLILMALRFDLVPSEYAPAGVISVTNLIAGIGFFSVHYLAAKSLDQLDNRGELQSAFKMMLLLPLGCFGLSPRIRLAVGLA